MYGFIYLTTNNVNGKKYIGMCKATHSKGYMGSGKLLKRAIKKYGKENFSRIVLEECDSFDQLSKAEYRWIKHFNAVEDSSYYNLTAGGFGGSSDYLNEYWSSFTPEERKIARKWSRRSKVGKNNPMYGKTHSSETRLKIGIKSVGRNWYKPKREERVGSKNPNAKSVLLKKLDGSIEIFDCLKDVSTKYGYNYSTLKGLAQRNGFSKKYGISISFN